MDDKGINFPTFKERPEKVDIDLDILNDTIENLFKNTTKYDIKSNDVESIKDQLSQLENFYIATIFGDKVKC